MRFGIRVAPWLWIGLYPFRGHHRACRCRVHRHLLLRVVAYFLLACVAINLALPYALFLLGRQTWRWYRARVEAGGDVR